MQFIAPEGMSNIEVNFVTSTTALTSSLQLSTVLNSTTGGYSTAFYQSSASDASFKITADAQGTDYDGTAIIFKQIDNLTGAIASWDKENKEITISGDFENGVTAASIETAINNNSSINTAFTFTDIGLGSGDVSGTFGSGTTVATTTGGNQYESLTITLATSNGQVTSTAADVIALINNTTEMQNLGISASNAFGSDGTGLVSVGSTRFDAAGAVASVGTATATTTAAKGTDSQITVTARNSGDAYDNISIVFQDGVTQGNEYVEYDANNKKLIVHIQNNVSTANDVVNSLANNSASAAAAALFSMTAGGDGTGAVTTADDGSIRPVEVSSPSKPMPVARAASTSSETPTKATFSAREVWTSSRPATVPTRLSPSRPPHSKPVRASRSP